VTGRACEALRVPVAEAVCGKPSRAACLFGSQVAHVGEAIVRRLAAGGARVATTARSPLPDGQAVDLFVKADISTREGVDTVVRAVLGRLGGLDLLVNNVGGSSAPGGGVLALTDEEWQRTIDANLFAAVRLDHAFLPGMLEQGSGVVIHISSIQRRLPRRRSDDLLNAFGRR
jgi:NAD(P)-dependent dehydrogenase (short-subunit alcohol dehydrogenase family)